MFNFALLLTSIRVSGKSKNNSQYNNGHGKRETHSTRELLLEQYTEEAYSQVHGVYELRMGYLHKERVIFFF